LQASKAATGQIKHEGDAISEIGDEIQPGDLLYDKCPWGNEDKEAAAYQRRIRQCFTDAYRFLDTHKHAQTEEEWNVIAGSLAVYTDPLTVDLIVAALNEIERNTKIML